MIPFAIQVVDGAGAPVPCATLETVDHQVFVADEAGLVAFDEPGLTREGVWFTVDGPVARVDADFFGFRGVVLQPVSGGSDVVVVDVRGPPDCVPGDGHSRAIVEGFTDAPFRIEVIDAATGRGVPLARVDVGGIAHVTDSAGNVAVRDPALLGTTADVGVVAWHRYAPVDPPAPVLVEEGGQLTLEVVREQIAERLYRLTGRGVYRDTVLLGLAAPTAEPALAGRVMGQDSILVFEDAAGPVWLWGDTNRPDYPLGLFDVAGAVPRPLADPADGIDLDYYVDGTGFARAMAPVPGSGPTWLTAPMAVDDGGVERIVAVYGKFDGLVATERGLVVWDEAAQVFTRDTVYPSTQVELEHQVPLVRDGHVYLHEHVRLPATIEAARDPAGWEIWSPISGGAIERHPDGEARWEWRPIGRDTDPAGASGADAWDGLLLDVATGDEVRIHNHSIVASPWRGRFVNVLTRDGGDDSWLGELWYAEADTPLGPWLWGVRVVEHDDYTLYNPYVHEALQTDGRSLLVQGTYTTFFAGSAPTPLYDYNQLVFGLDLEDERLVLPVPVYDVDGALATLPDLQPDDPEPLVLFHAPDRRVTGALGAYRTAPDCAGGAWAVSPEPPGHPRLWVMPDPAPGRVALRSATSPEGEAGWFVDVPADHTEDPEPVGYVWPPRGPRHVPVLDWLPALRLDAGDDRCLVEDEPGNGAPVTLDAGGSVGVDGTFRWELDGAVVAEGVSASVRLPVGVHHVVLVHTSPAGTPSFAEAIVQIDPGVPATAPPGTEPEPTSPRRAGGDSRGCGCRSGSAAGGLVLLVALCGIRPRWRESWPPSRRISRSRAGSSEDTVCRSSAPATGRTSSRR